MSKDLKDLKIDPNQRFFSEYTEEEFKKAKIIIDFSNIKTVSGEERLYFYEAKSNTKVGENLIEYAYLDNTDTIKFKPYNDIDEHYFPKKDIREFYLYLLKRIALIKYGIKIDVKSKSSRPYFNLKIIGKKVEIVAYLAIQMGLLPALDFLKIKYQFAKRKKIILIFQ